MKYVIELLNNNTTKVYANKAAAIAALDDYAYHRPGQPVVVIYKKDSDRTALIAIGVSNGLGEDDGSPSSSYKRPSDSKRYIIIGECEASNNITTTLSADQIVLRYIDYSNLITEINGKHGPGQFHDGVALKDSTNFQGHFGYLNAEEGCFTNTIPDGTTVQAAFEAILCGKRSNPTIYKPVVTVELTPDTLTWEEDSEDPLTLDSLSIKITNFSSLNGIKNISIESTGINIDSFIDDIKSQLIENGEYTIPGNITVFRPDNTGEKATLIVTVTSSDNEEGTGQDSVERIIESETIPAPTIDPPSKYYSELFPVTIAKNSEDENIELLYKIKDGEDTGEWVPVDGDSIVLDNIGSSKHNIVITAENRKGEKTAQKTTKYTYNPASHSVNIVTNNCSSTPGSGTYTLNADVLFTITANSGYTLPTIDNIRLDGIDKSSITYTSTETSSATLSFKMPNNDVTITITATEIQWSIFYETAGGASSPIAEVNPLYNRSAAVKTDQGNIIRYANSAHTFHGDTPFDKIKCRNCTLVSVQKYDQANSKYISAFNNIPEPETEDNVKIYKLHDISTADVTDKSFAVEIKID